MDLVNLKQHIESGIAPLMFRIFKLPKSGDKFLSDQYIKAIADINKLKISYIDSLDSLSLGDDLFETEPDVIYIYTMTKIDTLDDNISENKNLIIRTRDISDDIKNKFNYCIAEFPELDDWQIADYGKMLLKGVSKSYVDWLMSICKDPYRIKNECDKVTIFPEADRDKLFDTFVNEGLAEDLSSYTIFNFTNALITKNINQAKLILSEIEHIDIEPVGIITVLYKNIKNIINIQLDNKATAESLGMTTKQFNAIKYNIGYFNKQSLIEIFNIITDIDYKLKSGQLPANLIIDYLMLNILSR